MVSILLTIFLFITLLITLWRRKKAGVTGLKSGLTAICLFLMASINIVAYWLGLLGLTSWMITGALILLGVYFTKYLISN
ncbi:hypothetical protein [Bacillus solitudinis]|uniref:hypothetical protein n=1 Tax=Bacillus solitudinis TaxID=2014074 RepID=UPI000C249D29|nr:hypothetical protein [Bacillus solitudinis]